MLEKHWNDCINKYNKNDIFGLFLQGSQNYEMETINSDIDSKCLLIPNFSDIVFCKNPISHTFIRENDEHIDFKDIRNYFNLFKKQNINIIEILFSKEFIINENYKEFWEQLYNIREDVAHINTWKMCKMICGMSKEKLNALCHEYPSKVDIIKQYGYDSKQLHHIIRLRDFIERYLNGESFESCLVPLNKEYLLKIKTNEIIFTPEEAVNIGQKYCDEIYDIYKSVPEINDNEETINKLNDILINVLKYKLSNEILTINK